MKKKIGVVYGAHEIESSRVGCRIPLASTHDAASDASVLYRRVLLRTCQCSLLRCCPERQCIICHGTHFISPVGLQAETRLPSCHTWLTQCAGGFKFATGGVRKVLPVAATVTTPLAQILRQAESDHSARIIIILNIVL